MSVTRDDGPFETLLASFEAAESAAGGSTERFFRIAGATVRLRFAGPALATPLTAAIAHLATDPEEPPALTVCLWDDASSGMRAPVAALVPEGSPEHGVLFLRRGRVDAAYEPESGALSALDHGRNVALFRVRDARSLPAHEQAAPLRKVLHWWTSRRGLQLVHAAAVGTAAGGVLLVGKGGSGKSTCALTCVGSGLGYAGDDYCALSMGAVPRVHSLYSSAKIDGGGAQRCPSLAGDVAAARLFDGDKAVLFLHPARARDVVPGFPVAAVVAPRIGATTRTLLARISPGRVLAALAPSTMFQLPGGAAETLSRLAAVVRVVPCHSLELGSDLSGVPGILSDLLAEESCRG